MENLKEKVVEISKNLSTLKEAETKRYLLANSPIRAINEDKEIADAAFEYIRAANTYNELVRSKFTAIISENSTKINEFLTELLKTPIPGLVTWPIADSAISKRVIIHGLTMLSLNERGEPFGIAYTGSEDGRSHTTENFIVKDGVPYFLSEDIY